MNLVENKTDIKNVCEYCSYEHNEEMCPLCGTSMIELWDNNLTKLYEECPEYIVTSSELIVSLKILDHDINALIDTGATKSFIYKTFIDKYNLGYLIDKRFKTDVFGINGINDLPSELST